MCLLKSLQYGMDTKQVQVIKASLCFRSVCSFLILFIDDIFVWTGGYAVRHIFHEELSPGSWDSRRRHYMLFPPLECRSCNLSWHEGFRWFRIFSTPSFWNAPVANSEKGLMQRTCGIHSWQTSLPLGIPPTLILVNASLHKRGSSRCIVLLEGKSR